MRRAARRAAILALVAAAGAGRAEETVPRVRAWLESGPPEKSFDVVFVGDGYTRADLVADGKFWKDVGRYAKRFLAEPPFCWYRAKTNVRAVFLESAEEGCLPDPAATKPRTALGSFFDSPKGRLLTFRDHAALEAAVERAGQTDVVLVMVNTERYGGAGTVLESVIVRGRPLPAPTFAAQDTASFLIAVHELGHSFAGLADEYVDDAETSTFKLPKGDADLREANVTLAAFVDPAAKGGIRPTTKWAHFAKLPGGAEKSWAHEGGYYRAAGVFRPWPECRMRKRGDAFCPICCEEVSKAVQEAIGEPWDDAAWHVAHPLSLWR